MGGSAHASFTLAAVLGLGAIAAYTRRGSMPSLLGGLGSSTAMLGSGVLIDNGYDLEGHGVGLAASTVLAGGMGLRAARTGLASPAGAIALLSALSAAYHGKKFNDWR